MFVPQASTALPGNAAVLRNLIHGANHIMSHILHFYHLAALDYVKPTVWNLGGSGTFADLTRPFLAPRYDDSYYITDQRVLAMVTAGLVPGPAVTALTGLPGCGPGPGYVGIGNAINAYLVGQYLKALDMRRIIHEAHAIYSGRAPICSGFTPGGVTASVTAQSITDYQTLLNQVINFIGSPSDFANGIAGTMMFDVVAAAHLFPEYFWIGNSYGHFLAYGIFEGGFVNGVSDYTNHVLNGLGLVNLAPNNPDNRGFARGYRTSAQFPYDGGGNFIPPTGTVDPVFHARIVESIANSRYAKVGGNYPDGSPFKHPWIGKTTPDPNGSYSYLKSPRLDVSVLPGTKAGVITHVQTSAGTYVPFEVGPLARQVVQGNYYAGVLNDLGYTTAPTWGQAGPDCATGADALGAALQPVYASIPPARPGGPNLAGVSYTGDSVLDRIAARAVECLLMALQMNAYLGQLTVGASGCTDPAVPSVPKTYRGYGMTEASRGALSHWIAAKNGRIQLYQAVVPTTWNASPRDVLNQEGPAERSLQGTGPSDSLWVANPAEPIEVIRTTHSYDFCIACAVHMITPEGEVKKAEVPALPG